MSFFNNPRTARTLHEHFRSSECFAGVRATVDRIQRPRDRADLLVALTEVSRCLGADAAFYVNSFRPLGKPASHRLIVACDPAWSQEYEGLSGIGRDPWLRYAECHSKPVRASDIPVQNDDEQAVVALARRHGFRSAAILPVHSAGGGDRSGAMVLGSDAEGYFEDDDFRAAMTLARGLAMEFHEQDAAIERALWLREHRLTPLEIQLLAYEWSGKCTKDIAAATGITARAIDLRFFRINARLRSPNRHTSARMAAEFGAI